VSNRVGPQVI